MHSMGTSASGEGAEHFRVVSIGSLSQEHGRYALSPNGLTAVKTRRLSSTRSLSRIAPLDVIKVSYLLNIDQNLSVYGV